MSGAAARSRIAIDGEMSIYRAGDLKTLLLDALRQSPALEVDLSGVTELDTSGLQVLMLAKQTARANGGELYLQAHSPAVLDVFELLDMGAWFGDALLIAPAAHA